MKRSVPAMWFVVLFAAALLLPASVRSAAQPAQPPPTLIDRAGGAYNGIEVTLAADAAPAPGGLVTLTLTARPLRDAPNIYVEWELPDGGQLLGGPANDALGPVAAGQSVTNTRQVRLAAANVYQLSARAFYFPDQAISLAARGVLFFDVRDGRSTVSDLDPRAPVYTPPPARPTVDKSHLAGASTRAADGCFTVRGTLTREMRSPLGRTHPSSTSPTGSANVATWRRPPAIPATRDASRRNRSTRPAAIPRIFFSMGRARLAPEVRADRRDIGHPAATLSAACLAPTPDRKPTGRRAAQRQVGEKEVMFAAAGGLGRRGQREHARNRPGFLGGSVHDVQRGGDGE